MIFKVGSADTQETNREIFPRYNAVTFRVSANKKLESHVYFGNGRHQTHNSVIDYGKSTSFGQIKEVKIPVC